MASTGGPYDGMNLTCCLLLSAGFVAGRIIMALLAKFFIFISFDAVYVYAAELFPTVIRYDLYQERVLLRKFGGGGEGGARAARNF